MSDKQLLDFIEARGIQIWPQRKEKSGPVLRWWVQNTLPFVQLADGSLRAALTKLADKIYQPI